MEAFVPARFNGEGLQGVTTILVVTRLALDQPGGIEVRHVTNMELVTPLSPK